MVRQPILVLIRQDHPNFPPKYLLATTELNEDLRHYLENFLVREVGEFTEL